MECQSIIFLPHCDAAGTRASALFCFGEEVGTFTSISGVAVRCNTFVCVWPTTAQRHTHEATTRFVRYGLLLACVGWHQRHTKRQRTHRHTHTGNDKGVLNVCNFNRCFKHCACTRCTQCTCVKRFAPPSVHNSWFLTRLETAATRCSCFGLPSSHRSKQRRRTHISACAA